MAFRNSKNLERNGEGTKKGTRVPFENQERRRNEIPFFGKERLIPWNINIFLFILITVFSGTTVEMDHIDVVPHMDRWPSFHNGVAAGLRIPTDQGNIDSNWITFNKPKDGSSHPNDFVEHGGLLMALGLNGHLAKLGKLESFDYLVSNF